MNQPTKLLIASLFVAASSAVLAQGGTPGNVAPGVIAPVPAPGSINTGAPASSTSADPFVQKREADAAAKKEYKEKRSATKAEYKANQAAAKSEYKTEKAEAKSDMKMEKREASTERSSAIAADPAKPAMPGQTNYSGK
ncbi:MAG: hypothetical protein V4695_06360 [Pseudomonadota bacterium]